MQHSETKSKEKSELCRLSYKFWRALETLKSMDGKNNGKVRTIVNRHGGSFTATEFSRLLHFQHKPTIINATYLHKLTQVLSILDPYILDKLGYVYDDKEEEYGIPDNTRFNPLFEGVLGQYLGYSLDYNATKLNKEPYVHLFKVNMVSNEEVVCVTQKATMQGKKMSMIGTNRIGMEIGNDFRRVYLIVVIGNTIAEDLKRIPMFRVAYIDSGHEYVKCGLAMLERAKENFDEFIPKSIPLSELRAKKTDDVRDWSFLEDSQLYVI